MTLEQIKLKKQEQGITNEALAELSGVPLGTLQKVLSGATKKPRLKTLLAIERAVMKFQEADFQSADPSGDFLPFDPYGRGGILAEAQAAYSFHKKRQGDYTLEDYYALPDDRRAELIDGVIYDMASPTVIHQAFMMHIWRQLDDFIYENGGDCAALTAPLDVQLDRDDRTMVQPDILVVCDGDRDRIRKSGICGAPDMVIEILSPATKNRDIYIKGRKYQEAGVREYWMIHTDKQRVVAFHDLQESDIPVVYTFQDSIPVHIWEDRCLVDFPQICSRIRNLPGVE